MGRPAIADGQLRRLPDGRYCVRFKRPWQDGSTAVVLTGIELVGRLAALIPPPRMHLVRYYGVFAPHSRLRKRVVPRQQPKACEHASASDPEGGVCSRQKRMTWAQLSRRVFEIDVAQCPRCQARMQQVAVITNPNVIRRMLDCMQLAQAP